MIDNQNYQLPPIRWFVACIEISLIVCSVLIFVPQLQNSSPDLMINGDELPFLLNSGQIASQVYKQTGRIPLWNPFIGSGEPLLENLFSFTLNPLMTLPMLVGEPIQGVKFSIVLHILLMGIGGWTLARVLRLGSGGRVLLGLLLAGSGSMASAVGAGFYQIGLSLSYVPWIIAGLIGTLYLRGRWPICLLAVASMLMLFAGTFWYVLPTAFVALVLVIFAYLPGNDALQVDRIGLQRLVLAMFFVVGLSAIRLLPLANIGLYGHLSEPLSRTYDIGDIIKSYFTPSTPPIAGFLYNMFAYHYILPFAFAIVLIIARLLIGKCVAQPPGTWRIVLPAVLLIVFFTLWAREGTPLLKWLYAAVPFLQQLRSPVRMAAVGAFWIAVLAAIFFDDIIRWLWSRASPVPMKRSSLIAQFCLGGLLIFTLVSVVDVFINWSRLVAMETTHRRPDEQAALFYLRTQHPTAFLSVGTFGMFGDYSFYATWIRSATGNPNIWTNGLPPTIGTSQTLEALPEYAAGLTESYQVYLRTQDYVPVTNAPRMIDQPTLWQNTRAFPYAFEIEQTLLIEKTTPLTSNDVQLPITYSHQIDSIHVTVAPHNAPSVLVVQETCYPGWKVSINGQPAKVVSISGRLGVILPEKPATTSVEIVFTYEPPLLFIGAVITFVSILLFTLFALKLDRMFIKVRRRNDY